ncbi:MAG: hypothetical protein ACE5OS_09685 [Anaerolineae bacterium]
MSEQRVDREAIRQAIIEEAEYWDKTDTADMMAQETEWFTFEWSEREDRCERCGGGMDTRRTDLPLAGGRVILHDVPHYVCRTPGCGNTQLPHAVQELADRIEALVREMLVQETPATQRTPSPEPALVREECPPYGEENSGED